MTPRNFSATSKRDAIVYGADRPGHTREFIDEWIEDMRERGIRRVVCLPAHERVAKYDDLLGAYAQRFVAVTHAPIDDRGLPSPEVLEAGPGVRSILDQARALGARRAQG